MTHPAKHRNLSRAFVAIFAAIFAALVVAHPASSAVVDGNSPVTFTLTASSQRSPVININGASTCSVVITSAGTGFTLTPQATSDTQANVAANTASWNTATGISSGSITSTGTYTGSIAASGLTAFSVYSTTIGSANIVGSIYCSSAEIPGSGGGPYNPSYTQTAANGSFVGVSGYDGAHVNAANVDTSGNLSVKGNVTGSGTFTMGGSATTLQQDAANNLLVNPAGLSSSGTIASNGASVVVPTGGYGGLSWTISGTWVGTISFSGSNDGGTTYPWTIYATSSQGYSLASTTTNYSFYNNIAQYSNVKIAFTAYTSGTATITYHLSAAQPGTILIDTFGNTTTVGTPNDGTGNTAGLYASAENVLFNGSTWDKQRKDTYAAGPAWFTMGGGSKFTVASAATSNAIKTGAGRLARLLVTTTGSGVFTCYDGTTATGTVVAVIAASAPVGTVEDVQMPLTTGLSCVSATSGPAVTGSYW